MNPPQIKKLHLYQVTVIFSVLFSLLGFSYNVWRLEVSENNNITRTACFEMLLELSEMEQLIYLAHYDKDLVAGSPRKGWVKVGLIEDLSVLTKTSIQKKSSDLKLTWSTYWETIPTDRKGVDETIAAIDKVRNEIKAVLNSLE